MYETRRRALAILPWLLLFAGLAWQVAQAVPRGHGLLVVLVPVWLLATVLVRAVAGRRPGRRGRLLADAAFAVVCVLLGTLGGFHVLPAIVAFAVTDAASLSGGVRSEWPASRRAELLLGVCTLAAAAFMTAFVVGTPMYEYASTTISSTGEVTETSGSYGLPLMTGLVFFIAPAAVVLLGAIMDFRQPGTGRWLIGLIAVVLTVLSVLGGFSIGMFLVPMAVLAAATFVAAGSRTAQA